MFPGPQIEPPAAREQLLTMSEVAKWLRMSKAWVYRHSGRKPQQPVIPSILCGTSRRFRASDVERFIDEQTEAARRQQLAVVNRRAAR